MVQKPDQPKPPGVPTPPRKEAGPREILGMERATWVKVVIGLAIAVIFIIFVIQNSNEVKVDFVFASARIRLIWVFLACAVIGGIVTWLVGRPRRRALRALAKKLEQQQPKPPVPGQQSGRQA